MQPDVEHDYIDWKGWNSTAFGKYSNEECIQFAAEVRRTGIALNRETRVLEVGFGNGSFAGWIKQFTPHYVGIESNPVLVDSANAAGIEAYPSIAELDAIAGGGTFDLIAAFDVIEHMALNDIVATPQVWKRHLSDRGRILIRIPSGDSPFSGRVMYGDITHKTLLATTALQQIAPLAGLNLVATYSPALPVFGFGPRKAVERAVVTVARKLITFLVNATFHGNRHGVVTSNLIAIFKAQDTRD
ncbi:MAG: class I SAM-dependent methyltransferase [Thiomonas delicata]